MTRAAQCKGSLLLNLQSYAVTTYGETAWSAVLADQIPEDRAILAGIILASGWYPVRVWNNALSFLVARHANGMDDVETRRISAHLAENDLNTVYKMVLRLGSPSSLLKRTESLWSRYFDVGTFGAEEVDRQRWRLWLDCPAGNDMPNRLSCESGVPGWIEVGMRGTGVSGTVKHVDCRFQNGSRCEYVATW